jgi:DNA replication protein DnaC
MEYYYKLIDEIIHEYKMQMSSQKVLINLSNEIKERIFGNLDVTIISRIYEDKPVIYFFVLENSIEYTLDVWIDVFGWKIRDNRINKILT